MAACKRHVFSSTTKHRLLAVVKSGAFLFEKRCTQRYLNSQSVFRNEDIPSDYREVPEYPKCFDTTPAGRQRKIRQGWYDRVLDAPTVEEKYLQFWPAKYNRYLAQMFTPITVFRSYNTLPLVKYATRTHFLEGLPSEDDPIAVDAIVEHITPYVITAVKTAFENYKSYSNNPGKEHFDQLMQIDKLRGQMMIDQVHRIISLFIGQQHLHVRQSQVDYEPRIDSFWFGGGFPSTYFERALRHKKYLAGDINAPMNLTFQFKGNHYMNIRNEDPLPPFVDVNDALCTATEENRNFETSPNAYGFFHDFRYPSMVPGFWPGEPCGFGTLSFLTREYALNSAKLFGVDSIQDTLHSYGVISSFGWLLGLAFDKGFTPYQDLTYPITTQTVITNGQMWSFYNYQLNTICFSNDFINDKYRNVCWGTNEMKLFDSVTDEGVHGFNPAVLKCLVRMYLNSPQSRVGVSLKPYLKDVSHASDVWEDISLRYRSINANKELSGVLLPKNYFTLIYKTWFDARMDKLK
ncbi:mitochondrial ribosomal protein, S30 [Chamberlinius hualienensis]